MEPMIDVGTAYGKGTILIGRLRSDGSGYIAEGLVAELDAEAVREPKRLAVPIRLYRAPFAYPEMAHFEYHHLQRAVHPDEIVETVAQARSVAQIHALNWNQLAVAYAVFA